ncbi:sulfate ABC transporter substrate-binding protein [Rariglobus hedericola]|uniref:Sulfate ABC transporter substrate-binding protein n=1 Tax=Rariglobus hedericola TaxID=2597822 RepID=A0A556QDI3_9BACT|nr:sulfate ABC transporter substrate-binding protein [Rariglobus hedericola]TSJ74704.1 sulfate ABC transporter substrate-binding protein [Rariglobus hedericola]
MKRSLILGLTALLGLASPAAHAAQEILNASYDVSRELFIDVNKGFVPYWKQKSGEDVTVKQTHQGSSKQALAIREGLRADVVTFNQVNDVQILADSKLVAKDWVGKFPHNSSPFYSVHSILVRKGNPKAIKDWSDLAKPGVTIVQVNPKTGGNGRYAVLAYYAAGLEASGGDTAKARELLKGILANVVVFESGGRAATSTFTEREIGDVLVTFESETSAFAASGKFEVITPSVSILSEFPVAVVDKVAKKKGTEAVSKAYLDYLYTPEAQEIVARNFYRPRNEEVAKRYADKFAPVKVLEVDSTFGGWAKATTDFFDNGALVDTLLKEIAAAR